LIHAVKEKIKWEVKEAVNTIIKAAFKANYALIIEPGMEFPEFGFTQRGKHTLTIRTMKKLISLALSFCILIMQSGCTATTHLTMDEASHAKSEKNFLVLHTPNKLYRLYDYKFTENTLEGTLKQYASKTKNDLHVYTSLNFELNSDPESSQFITVKKTDINNMGYPIISRADF